MIEKGSYKNDVYAALTSLVRKVSFFSSAVMPPLIAVHWRMIVVASGRAAGLGAVIALVRGAKKRTSL